MFHFSCGVFMTDSPGGASAEFLFIDGFWAVTGSRKPSVLKSKSAENVSFPVTELSFTVFLCRTFFFFLFVVLLISLAQNIVSRPVVQWLTFPADSPCSSVIDVERFQLPQWWLVLHVYSNTGLHPADASMALVNIRMASAVFLLLQLLNLLLHVRLIVTLCRPSERPRWEAAEGRRGRTKHRHKVTRVT